MPVLHPAQPLSTAQERMWRMILIVIAGLGIVLGVWEAITCAAITSAYEADYMYGTAIFFTMALVVIGGMLAIYWRTRAAGLGCIAAGLLSCATFYAGIAVLGQMDRVAWRHDTKLQSLDPKQQASIIIHFRPEITRKEVEAFRSAVLTDSAGRFPSFVRSYANTTDPESRRTVLLLRLAHSTDRDVIAYLEKIRSDRRVERIEDNH